MSVAEYQHIPVLSKEVVSNLFTSRDGVYVDMTFGRGGHCLAALELLSQKARVIGLDRDLQAIESAELLSATDSRLTPAHSKFSDLKITLAQLGLGLVQGILMDLGVSSPQLDDPARGFSFQSNGPLDMRMDRSNETTAADWLNKATATEIELALRKLGDEKQARAIAKEIFLQRPLSTTRELSDLVLSVKGNKNRRNRVHPATKTFQALRMVVNSETDELSEGLESAFESLVIGGRLAVISFHSQEDRIVKSFFYEKCGRTNPLPRRIPIKGDAILTEAKMLPGPIQPGIQELNENRRARSARLRIIEKIKE